MVKIYDPQEGRNWHGPDFAFARSQFEAGLAALGVQVEAGFAKGLALLEDVSVREPHTPAAKKSPHRVADLDGHTRRLATAP